MVVLLESAWVVARFVLQVVAALVVLYIARLVVFVVSSLLVSRRVGNVPHFPIHPVFGSIPYMVKQYKGELYLMMRDMATQLGRISYLRFLVEPAFVVSDPELLSLVYSKENMPKGPGYSGLITMFGRGLAFISGDLWAGHRKLMSTGFTPQTLRSFFPAFLKHSQQLLARVSELASADAAGEVMVSRLLTDCTLDIIADTALRYPLRALHGENAHIADTFTKFMRLLGREGGALKILPLGAHFLKFKNRKWFASMDRILNEALATGKRDPPTPGMPPRDLLDVLIGARDADGRPMSDADIRAELLIFFLAGHETTALTLSWCLHLLTTHLDVQRKVIEEVDRVTGGKQVDLSMLPQFTYMTQVLRETLRMYAPASTATRTVTRDIEWKGTLLPKGSVVFAGIDAIHHDPEYYPEPFAFKPERMSDEEMAKRPQCAFMPFTAGPRICIGMNFFWMEAKALLATLLQRMEFRPAAGFVVEATSEAATLKPKYGVKVHVVPRAQAAA